jgi:hypothetical protein
MRDFADVSARQRCARASAGLASAAHHKPASSLVERDGDVYGDGEGKFPLLQSV